MKHPNLRIWSWIAYDWANTIFSMNVVTLTFGPWMTKDLGVPDIWVSLAYSVSMACVAVSVPVMGVFADRFRAKHFFFVVFTLLCILATAMISGAGYLIALPSLVLVSLFLFAMANYGYQGALVFYNAYLPELAPVEQQGRLSGYGTAFGYLGAIAGLLIVRWTVGSSLPDETSNEFNRIPVFWISALAFLFFACPSLVFLRSSRNASGPGVQISVRQAFGQVISTLRNVSQSPGLIRFLTAKFFYEDAISTSIVFMAVYSEKVLEFSPSAVIDFFLISTVFAGAGALISGYLVDRLGPKTVLSAALNGWIISLTALILVQSKAVYYILGSCIGMVLGATWTAARPLFIRLTPPGRLNEFFGLYALSGKAAAIAGPMVWGTIVLLLSRYGNHVKYRGAVVGLIVMLAAGRIILQGVLTDVRSKRQPSGGLNDKG